MKLVKHKKTLSHFHFTLVTPLQTHHRKTHSIDTTADHVFMNTRHAA